ncbi:hypothetical protein C8R44DRAFT_732296 [Mycena epipterygia]|nr:hypothetical protein C8R44DRAFT_732296 [Mycena epipterygia]
MEVGLGLLRVETRGLALGQKECYRQNWDGIFFQWRLPALSSTIAANTFHNSSIPVSQMKPLADSLLMARVILQKADGKTKNSRRMAWDDGSPFARNKRLWVLLFKRASDSKALCIISWRRADTSEPVGYMKFYDQIMSELAADFLIFQLVSVDGSVTVQLEDGNSLHGDNVQQSCALNRERGKSKPSTHSYRDKHLRPYESSRKSQVSAIIMTCVVHWNDKTTMPFDLSGYDPSLQKLIELGYPCCPPPIKFSTRTISSALIEQLFQSETQLIPHWCAVFSEFKDAMMLGRLFARLSQRRQIPSLLDADEEIRHQRTSATQDSEYQSPLQISLAPGVLQEARDAALRTTLSTASFQNCEELAMIVQAWEQYLVPFSHNASEAVDD